MTRCPQCKKEYIPDLISAGGWLHPDAEPYQRQQLQYPPYCSDKCFDEAISGHRSEYTYDEKGRRYENGVRKIFADPPREC